jgi:hypothetical protein
MIRKLLRHHQQRKMLVLLVVEELNRILIEQQGQRLDK